MNIETNKPLVSILCPTRGRPKEFAEMQKTLLDNIEDVEVFAIMDFDDKSVNDYNFERFTRMSLGKRDWLSKRMNIAAKKATGSFLMWGNDDMRFTGPAWVDYLLKFDPDKPAVIGFKSGKCGAEHFQFPILTREGYRRQGFFAPEHVKGLYSDTWLYDVGKRAGCLNYIDSYYIKHLHWSDKSRKRDKTDEDRTSRGGPGDKGAYHRSEKERQRIADAFRN